MGFVSLDYLTWYVADKRSNYGRWLAQSLCMGTSTIDVHLLLEMGLEIPEVGRG